MIAGSFSESPESLVRKWTQVEALGADERQGGGDMPSLTGTGHPWLQALEAGYPESCLLRWRATIEWIIVRLNYHMVMGDLRSLSTSVLRYIGTIQPALHEHGFYTGLSAG